MVLLSFPHPLRKCKFVKRYKRFFVDVLVEETLEAVHCANSGSMKSCLEDGVDAYSLDSFNVERKLRHSLELLNLQDGLACLNTARANHFVEKILLDTIGKPKKKYFEIAGFPYDQFEKYNNVKREVKYNENTRFDFCLGSSESNKKCWIEVKSVSLRLEDGTYAFPDAVTQRGQKHLHELMEAEKFGDEAWMFFVIMRGSNLKAETRANNFRACHEIDSKYAALLEEARNKGVKVALVVPEITVEGFDLSLFKII